MIFFITIIIIWLLGSKLTTQDWNCSYGILSAVYGSVTGLFRSYNTSCPLPNNQWNMLNSGVSLRTNQADGSVETKAYVKTKHKTVLYPSGSNGGPCSCMKQLPLSSRSPSTCFLEDWVTPGMNASLFPLSLHLSQPSLHTPTAKQPRFVF